MSSKKIFPEKNPY